MAAAAITAAVFCHALERRCGIGSVRRPQGAVFVLSKVSERTGIGGGARPSAYPGSLRDFGQNKDGPLGPPHRSYAAPPLKGMTKHRCRNSGSRHTYSSGWSCGIPPCLCWQYSSTFNHESQEGIYEATPAGICQQTPTAACASDVAVPITGGLYTCALLATTISTYK